METWENETRRKGNNICINEQVTGQGNWAHCKPFERLREPIKKAGQCVSSLLPWQVEIES